jgi:hypothetical protein
LNRKLTLVSSPAGFGKTTLVSEFAFECERPVAWFSIDAEDDDATRFMTYLIASLESINEGLGSINPELGAIYELTPLYFYQGGAALEGIDWGSLLGLTGMTLVFALLAWWLFQRREIRVGGEGGWKLPKLLVADGRN